MARRRSATLLSTLVFLDEPQVIALQSYKIRLIAVAVDEKNGKALFFAVTVRDKDWTAYFDERVDLLYLFTYPIQRSFFTFDLMDTVDGKIWMDKYEGDAPAEWLPSPRFFAVHHTEEFEQHE